MVHNLNELIKALECWQNIKPTEQSGLIANKVDPSQRLIYVNCSVRHDFLHVLGYLGGPIFLFFFLSKNELSQ